ncbi:hypothetical protein AC579_1846 [Pseudocercospora musae]|uniref:Uncharacterized protein n=1 Tax=Pseudocercospora musae TaxID=113226 RepID=A0A139I7F7_9PEZI|nr:hypothetical protein AC579_1846 [Pseudocercospora musae]KXT10463.1 hypothetical protein AC579_1846 [Pseudocercospora musae]
MPILSVRAAQDALSIPKLMLATHRLRLRHRRGRVQSRGQSMLEHDAWRKSGLDGEGRVAVAVAVARSGGLGRRGEERRLSNDAECFRELYYLV